MRQIEYTKFPAEASVLFTAVCAVLGHVRVEPATPSHLAASLHYGVVGLIDTQSHSDFVLQKLIQTHAATQ
jgi:hypothetical protein